MSVDCEAKNSAEYLVTLCDHVDYGKHQVHGTHCNGRKVLHSFSMRNQTNAAPAAKLKKLMIAA